MDRTERFYIIERLLRTQKVVTFAQFREKLGVSPATIKRDIEYLRERLHAPIPYIRARGGYCLDEQLCNRYELPGLWLSAQEAAALMTFYHLLEQLQPQLLGDHIRPLQARLQALIEEKSRHTIDEVRARIRILSQAARIHEPKYFSLLAHATLARKRVDIRYYSRERDQESQRDLSPQRLVHYRDNWYLDAWDHNKQALRTFSVDCVRGADVSKAKARNVSDKTLDAELGSGYGIFAGSKTQIAKLRFTPARARWIANEQWHPKQKAHYDDQGRYVLELPYTDDRELTMDVLKYGADVEVLAPAALRKHVAECLINAAARYRERQPSPR